MDDGRRQAAPATTALAWATAWRRANTGPHGFYRSRAAETEFRTSIHVGNDVATAIAALITDDLAEYPDFTIIDIGSGSGRLLGDLAELVPSGVELIGVDIRERPEDLPSNVEWIRRDVDDARFDLTGRDGRLRGLLIAHEFLDDVPCDVVELDHDLRPCVVLVDPLTGAEELGPDLVDPACTRFIESPSQAAEWLARWWPPTRPLARREIGVQRDRTWSRLRSLLSAGKAIAIDYAHTHHDRARGVWDGGTLKGFAAGRPRSPIPDGRSNITAHVAMDSCRGPQGWLTSQHRVVRNGSIAGIRTDLGTFTWLIDPIVER